MQQKACWYTVLCHSVLRSSPSGRYIPTACLSLGGSAGFISVAILNPLAIVFWVNPCPSCYSPHHCCYGDDAHYRLCRGFDTAGSTVLDGTFEPEPRSVAVF